MSFFFTVVHFQGEKPAKPEEEEEQEEEEGEEEKRKKHQKKKHRKKERRSKSKDRRDSSPEKKELNINLPEVDAKPVPEKHISDENNDLYDGGGAKASHLQRPRSRSPQDPAAVFFRRPAAPTVRRVPAQAKAPAAAASSLSLSLHSDVGDEPDVESEVEEPPRSPRRQKSRGQLNMLSQSESRALGEEQASDSSSGSGDSFRRHLPPPPHHRPRKQHHRRKSPIMRDRSDSG